MSATNDYANQSILIKVREVDPEGECTLGIITKPDRLDHGSGSEAPFIGLARNEDIFKLGWHVVKNRKFEESSFSIEECNASEATYFRKSNFSTLPADFVGIEALRTRLSILLFDHIKRELPNLRKDLEDAMEDTTTQLAALSTTRAGVQDCRNYLTTLSLTCLEIIRAAVDGHYEGEYFQSVARSRQVCIYWLWKHCLLLSILPGGRSILIDIGKSCRSSCLSRANSWSLSSYAFPTVPFQLVPVQLR